MGGLDSLPQENFSRVQQLYLWKTQASGVERQGNMEKHGKDGVKSIKNTPRIAP